MLRINPVVSERAYQIVQSIPKLEKGKWISEAIEEKRAREQLREPFTEEQIIYIENLIRKIVKAEGK